MAKAVKKIWGKEAPSRSLFDLFDFTVFPISFRVLFAGQA
jgi:hypothetical protein